MQKKNARENKTDFSKEGKKESISNWYRILALRMSAF